MSTSQETWTRIYFFFFFVCFLNLTTLLPADRPWYEANVEKKTQASCVILNYLDISSWATMGWKEKGLLRLFKNKVSFLSRGQQLTSSDMTPTAAICRAPKAQVRQLWSVWLICIVRFRRIGRINKINRRQEEPWSPEEASAAAVKEKGQSCCCFIRAGPLGLSASIVTGWAHMSNFVSGKYAKKRDRMY